MKTKNKTKNEQVCFFSRILDARDSPVYSPSMSTHELRQRLKKITMTQSELAEKCGVSQRLVSQFLRGRAIHSDSLDRISEFIATFSSPISPKIKKKLARKTQVK